jgi:hypothetical protein
MIAAAAAYVALMACGLTLLPGHMQVADLLFPVVVAMTLPLIRRGWHRLDLFLLVFVAGSALSVPGSIAPRQAALDVVKEAYLWLAYFTLAAVMAKAGILRIARWLPMSAAVTAALALAAALIFTISGSVWPLFGQPMPLPYVGEVFRLTGTLETPEFFGNLLVVALPLALVCRAESGHRRGWTAAVAVLAVAAVLTFSKSLGGVAVAVTMLSWPRWHGRRGVALKALSVTATVLVLAAFNLTAAFSVRHVAVAFGRDASTPPPPYLYAQQDASGAETVDLRMTYNPMSYYLLKRAEWVAWRRHPVFGIGIGTFFIEAERAYQEGRLPQAYRRSAAHSTLFGRIAETGLVGLLTLIVTVVGVWRCARSARSAPGADGAVAWACAAAAAGLLINGLNVDIMHFRFLWLALAALRAADGRAFPV